MKCYNHSEVEAVAVCRSCGRALCRDCTTEVGLSCSCKERCESVVATMNGLVERSRTVYQTTGTLQTRNAVFIILLGILLLSLAGILFLSDNVSVTTYFFLAVGILFAGMGVVGLNSAKRLREK